MESGSQNDPCPKGTENIVKDSAILTRQTLFICVVFFPRPTAAHVAAHRS
jgi:hypothetical protein